MRKLNLTWVLLSRRTMLAESILSSQASFLHFQGPSASTSRDSGWAEKRAHKLKNRGKRLWTSARKLLQAIKSGAPPCASMQPSFPQVSRTEPQRCSRASKATSFTGPISFKPRWPSLGRCCAACSSRPGREGGVSHPPNYSPMPGTRNPFLHPGILDRNRKS